MTVSVAGSAAKQVGQTHDGLCYGSAVIITFLFFSLRGSTLDVRI